MLGAPRPVWVLIIGTFVNRIGSFFASFATLFLSHRGVSAGGLPLVLSGVGAATVAGSLIGGWLSDRTGRKSALALSMFASASALLLLVLAPSLPLVVAAVCLVGFFAQSYLPAASALLVDYTRPEDRVPIFAFFRLALNVGAALGPLIAGLIAAKSYSLLFGIDSVTSATCGIVILAGIRRVHHRNTIGPGASDTMPSVGPTVHSTGQPAAAQPRSGKPAWVLCGVLFAVALIYAQYRSTVPLILIRRGFSTVFYGGLLTLNASLVIVAELPISSRTRKLSWHTVLGIGIFTMAIGLAVTGLSSQAVIIVAAFAAFTLGEMIFAPAANASVAHLSPPGMTARYQGLLATAQTLGWAMGPAAGAVILQWTLVGLWTGTLVAAALCCAAIHLIWRVWH